MKYKDLTDQDRAFFESVYTDKNRRWKDRMVELCNKFDVTDRNIRRWARKMGLTQPQKAASDHYEIAKSKQFDRGKSRFIVTWAQNATPVHKAFFNNVLKYADYIDADVHVIAGRYRNPTSVWSDKDVSEEWWAQEVLPYLDAGRQNIHRHVTLLSDVKIRPTAVNPLSGLEGITGESTCIIGHPKVHLDVMSILEGHQHKLLLTTGACTVKNYTDSKSGKKGEFHHTMGFVVVEVANPYDYYIRQVTADSKGSFYDLFFKVDRETVTQIDYCEALIMGDIHRANMDENIYSESVKFTDKVRPGVVVLHDIFDGESISHHHEKDPIKKYHKLVSGKNSIKNEINQTVEFVGEVKGDMRCDELVIVRSNHDDFVDRWVMRQDWKHDLFNAAEYIEYTGVLLKGEAPKGIIPYILEKTYDEDWLVCLDRDDSYKVRNWELGNHGDLGQNGSRGSIQQFRKLSAKSVTAHGHSPGRLDGAVAVGTTTRLRLDYVKGPSDWMNAHGIIHEDGKFQHLLYFNGECTTLWNLIQ